MPSVIIKWPQDMVSRMKKNRIEGYDATYAHDDLLIISDEHQNSRINHHKLPSNSVHLLWDLLFLDLEWATYQNKDSFSSIFSLYSNTK